MVRIWQEPCVPGFRGRVTYRVDAIETVGTEVVVQSTDQLHAVVQEWLDAFLTGVPTTEIKPVDNDS